MKIVITGPESSGKTTLVEGLSNYFKIDHVPEIARSYLLRQDNEYDYADLVDIAKEQQKAIDEKAQEDKLMISDTDLITIKVWSQYKYNDCDEWIVKKLNENKQDLYLLCKPDMPWEVDPLRENPHDREELYKIYKNEIIKLEIPYVEISGVRQQRLSLAISAIEELINQD